MEHILKPFLQCRDRVLLDCSANLKVDEVDKDPDEVSFSNSSASYEDIDYYSLSLLCFRTTLMGKWLRCAGTVLAQAGSPPSRQSRRIELPGLYFLC